MPKRIYATIDTSEMQADIANGFHEEYQQFYSYTNDISAESEISLLKERLTKYLKKNNIRIKDGHEPDYRIDIKSISVKERMYKTSFRDTCCIYGSEPDSIYSILDYTIEVSIFNNERNNFVRTITAKQSCNEKVSSEGCGSPEISTIDRAEIVKMLAKDIRREIANTIYLDQGF